MLLMPAPPLLGVLLLLQAAAPAPKHTWIADLKANRATLGRAIITVQGDVVDIRSTSPTAKFGFYRLIDASDPVGLLVRTNNLPKDGGALRLRAIIAAQQPPDGSLLLDEVQRTRSDKRAPTALILLSLSGASLLTLLGLLVRAAIAERRYKVSPPLWLLPDAGPYGKGAAPAGGTAPALKYSPELEEADRRQRERLARRKRELLRLSLGSLALTALSGAWLLLSRPAAAQVPAFIFIEANDLPVPAIIVPVPIADTALALNPPQAQDSAPSPVPKGRRDSLAPRRDSAAGRRGGAERPAPLSDTVVTAPAPVLIPVPAPVAAPPPPPPPPPPAAPSPPPRDPAVERSRATEALADAANSLVAAINGRGMPELAVLLPEPIAGDLGRRERFMKLLKDFGPRAALGTLEAPTLTETGAEARFAVNFSWRGDFGVERRKTGHFLGTVRRDESGWRFQGASLLDAVP